MIRQANKTGIVSLGENIVTLLGVNADASLLQVSWLSIIMLSEHFMKHAPAMVSVRGNGAWPFFS